MNEQIAYVGLGSNIGNRAQHIQQAIKMLTQTPDVELIRTSDIIETKPLAGSDQPSYLNTVAELKTTLSARDFHKKMNDIETALGRTRNVKWSPRTIDLDLLLFSDQVVNQTNLIIPHPQMHLRTFVLSGLCQLNPNLMHPVMDTSVTELAARLNNHNFIPNLNVPQLISIAGIIGAGKTTLASAIARLLGCRLLLEPYDQNPYLPLVYAGQKGLALDSQLFFLINRAKQLNVDALPKNIPIISDYIFEKEHIYANLLLDKQQMELYKEVYSLCSPPISTPVLVIYLVDSAQNCLQRIHERSRPYEQKLETSFLDSLAGAHEQLFADWRKSPVIRIQTPQLDYSNQQTIDHLLLQVKAYINVRSTKQTVVDI